MKRRLAVLLVLGLLPWAGLNAQQTAVFRVSATVAGFCEMTAPDRAVGATTLLRATCTPNATYSVGLNKRTSPGAISGDTAGLLTVIGVGTGAPVDHSLFGGTPAAQVVPPIDYADTVSVRVYF